LPDDLRDYKAAVPLGSCTRCGKLAKEVILVAHGIVQFDVPPGGQDFNNAHSQTKLSL